MPAEWQPLVTALVPTYNGAAFISRTLDSLARQTWPHLEILVADDCSTDDTRVIVREFAAGHPTTRVLERTANLGWLRNSNDLMAQASGELMFFAFHDDVVAPTFVERLVDALRDRPAAVLAFSDMDTCELDGSVSRCTFEGLDGVTSRLGRGLVLAGRPDDWWVPNRGVFRASAYRQAGGIRPNDKGEYSADWTWLLHLALLGDFVRVPELLCFKYYKPGSVSKQWPYDPDQVAALRRAGVDEVRRSNIGVVSKAILVARIQLMPRLPEPVKQVARRLAAPLLR